VFTTDPLGPENQFLVENQTECSVHQGPLVRSEVEHEVDSGLDNEKFTRDPLWDRKFAGYANKVTAEMIHYGPLWGRKLKYRIHMQKESQVHHGPLWG